MKLLVDLVPMTDDFETGAGRFLSLLRRLEGSQYFEPVWEGEHVRLWDQPEAFVAHARDILARLDSDGRYFITALNDTPGHDVSAVTLNWGDAPMETHLLDVSFRGPHPQVPLDADIARDIITRILDWHPAQHVSLSWQAYTVEMSGVGSGRRGLGWLGWVPFGVEARELPEAEICEPLGRGTFIAMQRELWFAAGPQADPAAVARAQALERRLNAIGLLPTLGELQQGDWGRAGE